ncbi:MAG: hypothetical protein IKV94_06115 [Clostridia bacterium]|nr:hypothetical protein [Clostridia bacterium]
MKRNKRGISLITVAILFIIIAIIVGTVIALCKKDNNDMHLKEFFNKKIVCDFGGKTLYEIDFSQITNIFKEIAIRKNSVVLSNNDEDYISIIKDETLFENLPPIGEAGPGENIDYKIVHESENLKLYEITLTVHYPSKSKTNIYYELYLKASDGTLKISGDNKDKVMAVSKYITVTEQLKTLEEQFYGVTVLDERILDSQKITINEIYNLNNFFDVEIKVYEENVGVCFLSEQDTNALPGIKKIGNWKLVTEDDGYKVYHGTTWGSQSDALKIIKDDKEYFIDLTIPYYPRHSKQQVIQKLVEELLAGLK